MSEGIYKQVIMEYGGAQKRSTNLISPFSPNTCATSLCRTPALNVIMKAQLNIIYRQLERGGDNKRYTPIIQIDNRKKTTLIVPS